MNADSDEERNWDDACPGLSIWEQGEAIHRDGKVSGRKDFISGEARGLLQAFQGWGASVAREWGCRGAGSAYICVALGGGAPSRN